MPSLLRIRPPTPANEAPLTHLADDAALVARAKRDRRDFALLYDRYVDPIYRYCYRRLGTPEAAEDATSLVFTKALAALPRYREDGPSFRSWLFAIAHNTIADDLRSRLHRADQPLTAATEIVDAAPTPEDLVLIAEAEVTVRALLTRLSADQARILELRLAGLSGPEVAHALGRSRGSVKVAQFRAFARLRELLTDPGTREEKRRGLR